jgi:DNA-binding GntR family transcriptional regulator
MIDMVDMVMIPLGRDPGSDPMTSPTPKYEQFAESIRRQIRAGTLKPGDRLPSNTQFKADGWTHGVYIAGMRLLRAEGWVRGQPGEAVFVADSPPETTRPSE